MIGDGGIGPVAAKEMTGRGVGAAAERGAHADAVRAAGCDGANQAGSAVRAVRAGCQPCALCAAIDAISRSLGRTGAHAVAAWTEWPERVARLPRARVTRTGSLSPNTGGTLTRGPLVNDNFRQVKD